MVLLLSVSLILSTVNVGLATLKRINELEFQSGVFEKETQLFFIKGRSEYHIAFIDLLLKIAPGLCSQHENRNNFDHSVMPFLDIRNFHPKNSQKSYCKS